MRATALGFYNLGIYVGYSLAFTLGTGISVAMVRLNLKMHMHLGLVLNMVSYKMALTTVRQLQMIYSETRL